MGLREFANHIRVSKSDSLLDLNTFDVMRRNLEKDWVQCLTLAGDLVDGCLSKVFPPEKNARAIILAQKEWETKQHILQATNRYRTLGIQERGGHKQLHVTFLVFAFSFFLFVFIFLFFVSFFFYFCRFAILYSVA